MKVKDKAKNIYNELRNGDAVWGKIIQDGIKRAKRSRPCPDDFEENWMAFLSDEGEGVFWLGEGNHQMAIVHGCRELCVVALEKGKGNRSGYMIGWVRW